MKYFKLHRWDIIRHYREEKEQDARIRLKIKKRLTKLIILGSTYNFLKRTCEKFVNLRERIRQEEFENRTATRFKNVFLRYKNRVTSEEYR